MGTAPLELLRKSKLRKDLGNGKGEEWAGRAVQHRDNKTGNRLGFGDTDQRTSRATRGSGGERTFGFLED